MDVYVNYIIYIPYHINYNKYDLYNSIYIYDIINQHAQSFKATRPEKN